MVFSKMSALMMVVLTVVVATKVAEGQNTDCASKLVPCASYLNSTSPPRSCCDPLREAVTKQLACLCNLYQNPSFLAGLGINVTQALKLPGYCGIPGDISACKAPPPSSVPPPATPGVKDDNGVGKIAGTGLSSLLLFWGSFVLI